MNKLKKVTIYLILFLTLVVGTNTIKITKVDADSGFDSSYDSGGSSWGGSSDSWDSSSRWDSSDSSSGSGKPASLTSLMIVVVLFIVVFVIENEISKRKTEKKQIIKSKDMDLDLISKIDPNLNLYEFKNEAFNIYKDVQEAWMNLDDGKIRTLTTDELYNMYSMQLDTLRVKNEKNIMKEINLVTASLTNLKIENNIETATVIMTVNCYDYIVDSQNKVVRGNDKNKIEITYELTYIKSVGEKVNKCPNCGAEINDDNSTTCEYCRAIITRNTSKWVLSKKQSLNQRQL
jgi:predicted lipid-binding transport protein (Tim44 family)